MDLPDLYAGGRNSSRKWSRRWRVSRRRGSSRSNKKERAAEERAAEERAAITPPDCSPAGGVVARAQPKGGDQEKGKGAPEKEEEREDKAWKWEVDGGGHRC